MIETPRSLTRADLLAVRIFKVELPDGTVRIRALSAGYAVGLRGRTLGDADIFDMIARSICDDNGEAMLTAEDVAAMPLSLLQPILDGILLFNALGKDQAAIDLKKTPA
jgi:hypothetical protein